MTAGTENRAGRVPPTAWPDGGECAGFLAAFERLFTIGALYPAGHASCVEVTTALLAEMRRLLAGARALTIDAGRDAMAIQGRLVPLHERAASRLHEILETIGVFRVEIEAKVVPGDLHALAIQLLRAKHDAETAFEFRRLDFAGLPATVRLHAREFGRRLGGAEGIALRSDQIREAAAQALQELEGRELDEDTRATLRTLTEQFLQGIAERLEMNAPVTDGSRPAFTRSLDEVLSMGIRAVRHALARALPGGGEIGELQKLFNSAEMALAISPDEQAVELMVDILSDAARDETAETGATPGDLGDNDGCVLSLADLRQRLDTEEARAPLPAWEPVDRAEQIAVLGQLLLRAPNPEALAGAGRRFEKCLAAPLSNRDREVLSGALAALLGAANARVIDGALPHLLRPLRRSGAFGPLLAAACRNAPAEGLQAAWPHLVNELLLGLQGSDAAAQRDLRRVILSLPEEDMRKALPRLEALEALREKRVSAQLFDSPDLELWPFFALLLGSTAGDLIGPRLLESVRAMPSAWPGAPALVVLGEYASRHRPFLVRVLREVGAGAISTELLAAAGRILTEGLQILPAAQRSAAWLPGAIRALAILPSDDSGELLTDIVRRRRLLLFKAWPPACRDAAAHALQLRRGLESLAEAEPAAPHRGERS